MQLRWARRVADTTGLLVFIIEDTKLAVDLEQVDRVVRAATLRPLPGAPQNVLGLLNLYGTPVPVISLRKRLNFEERELDTTDEIVILKRDGTLLGIVVDEVEDVCHVEGVARLAKAAGLTHLTGALEMPGGTVLVHDIDKFLSSKEELDLAKALSRSEPE